MSCVETLEYMYSRVDVVVGQSVELLCNTSLTSDMMWTYDTNDGYVDYVYWNGYIDSDKPRLALKYDTKHSHNLVIYDAQLQDTGLYDCYDRQGTRKAGYQLAGMRSVYCISYRLPLL